jgi:hypothetical protein
LLRKPNWNPRSNDARLTPAKHRPGVDTWKIITKLMDQTLEDLRFSSRDKRGNTFSKSLKLIMAFLPSLSLMLGGLANSVFCSLVAKPRIGLD